MILKNCKNRKETKDIKGRMENIDKKGWKPRKGGGNGKLITLVSKVFNILWLNNFGDF